MQINYFPVKLIPQILLKMLIFIGDIRVSIPSLSRHKRIYYQHTHITTYTLNEIINVHEILKVRFELTHKLFLRQSPLPVGLLEHFKSHTKETFHVTRFRFRLQSLSNLSFDIDNYCGSDKNHEKRDYEPTLGVTMYSHLTLKSC